MKLIIGSIGALLLVAPLQAQWVKVPPANIPRTADGKPNLAASAPRLPDGKPDLSGIWRPDNTYNGEPANFAADLKVDDVPFQPWAKALYEERKTGAHSRNDPSAQCLPQGVPRVNAAPGLWKVVQNPGYIVILYEAFDSFWRQIFLGRETRGDAPPTWLGTAGKWDGDVLVVDTKGFKERLVDYGQTITEALQVTERSAAQISATWDSITIDALGPTPDHGPDRALRLSPDGNDGTI